MRKNLAFVAALSALVLVEHLAEGHPHPHAFGTGSNPVQIHDSNCPIHNGSVQYDPPDACAARAEPDANSLPPAPQAVLVRLLAWATTAPRGPPSIR